MRIPLIVFGLLLPWAAFAQGSAPKAGGAAPTYTKEIRPLLAARCVVCHSSANLNTAAVSGGLALDSYEAIKRGVVGKNGAQAIYTPGKSADSELMRRLTTTSPTQLMPRGGPPLPAAQIALFKRWIDAGAPAGGAASPAAPATPSPTSLAMPTAPGTQDVRLATLLKPTPDLVDKNAPKDAVLAFALKIGPLPPITA